VKLEHATTGPVLTSAGWPGLRLGPFACRATVDEKVLSGRAADGTDSAEPLLVAVLSQSGYTLTQRVKSISANALAIHSELMCEMQTPSALNEIVLLEGPALLGSEQGAVRVLRNGGAGPPVGTLSDEAGTERKEESSQVYWVAYNRKDAIALLVGFLTFDRWIGRITTRTTSDGREVQLSIGFDASDVLLEPGEQVRLEEVVLMTGPDPWALLESYADLVKEKYAIRPLPQSPVSWCSWYPYRLGVTEKLLLDNAVMARERLKPFGFRYVEADLGWEKDHLPSTFEANDQFPHGLKWLSERMAEMGFVLGVWKAPWTISEFDPISKEHPDWLHKDESGKPVSVGPWFWEPHGDVYVLDLSNPEAIEWLRLKVASLAQRGVGYFKWDFLSAAHSGDLRKRHDPRVATGAFEAARIGSQVMHEAVTSVNPDAVNLNCNGLMMPGVGIFEILYACSDTGNTGYIDWDFQKRNFTNLAAQLFKHGRWGILQPSCTCVGLPGTIEEARLRATVTFMSGGELNIGDDLTVLPEDRWEVLLSILPLHGRAAKPLDLFEPMTGIIAVVAGGQEDEAEKAKTDESVASSVWRLHMKTDWDEWDLIALFNYDAAFKLFRVPLATLGLDPNEEHVGYEFWSRQFLGPVPDTLGPKRDYMHDYTHPGDARRLLHRSAPDVVEAEWFGPAAKLIAIRRAREHPWVVGASFHQSCGTELQRVRWDSRHLRLSGELHRPTGSLGEITVTGLAGHAPKASVAGREVHARPGANGSIVVPVEASADVTPWEIRWV